MAPERGTVRLLAAGLVILLLGLAGVSAETSREEADRLAGPPPGGVTGKVMNGKGEPLAGARVSLRRGERVRSAVTDSEGAYCFCRVPPARDYVLTVELEGFAGVLENDFIVGGRKLSVRNLILRSPEELAPRGGKGGGGD